jgi:flagella basal body P-ring formation protein FlgA
MNLVRPCPARVRLLAAGAFALATASAAATPIEPQLAERVRGLVGPSVTLPGVAQPAAAAPRVAIEIGELDPRLRLAPCRRVEPQLPAQVRLWGRTRIGLRCVDGERKWQVWLPVVVKVFAPALVTVSALPAGTVLAAEHLRTAEVDWAAEPQPPYVLASDLLGRTLGRALQPGEAVRGSDLRLRQWFAAGDTVQVLARGDGFVVGGEGQALNPGIEGQPVRVRTESGRVLTGLPVGQRRVEVVM